MSKNKSQRLTIRAHNIQFIETIASQMGISDLSEVINYLILDCKGLGYSFGNKPSPQPQPQQQPIGYSFDTSTFEPKFEPLADNQNVVEIDPVIARMSKLIENF